MSDPIAEAAAALEPDGDGDADLTADQERGGGGGDPEQMDVDESPEHWSVRLWQPLEGSLDEDHLEDYWSPDRGAENRLALVAKEIAGLEGKLPRVAHAVIGAAELYVAGADSLTLPSLGGSSDGESTDSEWNMPGVVNVNE